jgi:uncharacterized membrane protein (DUF2068 family)
VDPHRAQRLALLSFGYAAVFLIEGVGLTLRRRWAEWLTVGVTASFVPFELYETVAHFGTGKVIALAINVAVVAYLARRRLQEHQPAPRRRVPLLVLPADAPVTSPLPM